MRHRTTLYLEDELNFKVQRFLNRYHESTGVRLSKNAFIESLVVKALQDETIETLSEKIEIIIKK